MPATTVSAVRTASSELYRRVCIPAAAENVSSKVTAKMRLYKKTYKLITTMPRQMLMYTSDLLIAKILPNM